MTSDLDHRIIPGFCHRIGDPCGHKARGMQDFIDGFFGLDAWEAVSRQDDGRPGYGEGLCFRAAELGFQQEPAA